MTEKSGWLTEGTPFLPHLHQPFVVKGDANREDIVKEDKTHSAECPAEKLHGAHHGSM